MLNKSLKKEAIERLEKLQKEYGDKSKSVETVAINLYNGRKSSLTIIEKAEIYINSLANTPKEFSKDMEEIKINRKEFNHAVDLEMDASKTEKIAGGSVAIATTFGTASTGTAIASLSGAAATNAALAWLGGGALAAGGGGMAAGNAFLALAGPIGWGIGAVGMGIGVFTISSKNKKIAREATNAAFEVKEAINKMEKGMNNIKNLLNLTEKMNNGVFMSLKSISLSEITDYREFNESQKRELGSLVNNLKSLSILINKRLDGESMDEIEYVKAEI